MDELGEIEFFGPVGTQVIRYARTSRRFARDLAAELESAAHDSRVAMSALKGHPALLGLDVKIRARRVSRKLKRAKELAQGISAESVKFAANTASSSSMPRLPCARRPASEGSNSDDTPYGSVGAGR